MAKTKRVRLVSDDIRCRQNAALRPDALGSERVLAIAIIFCCVMVVVEGVGGFMAHSLAVMSDAVHMLADVFALSISLFSARAAKWGADSRRTFGWRRAEVIGALASIFTTWFLVVWIVFSAVERTVSIIRCAASRDHHGRCEKLDAPMMLGLGAFGLAMNIVLATILFCGGGGHAHSHGSLSHNEHSHEHSHGAASVCMEMMQETGQSREELTSAADTDACVCDHDHDHDHDHNHHDHNHHDHAHAHGGGGNSSMNVRAALLHVIGDCLQAVGVVVAAGVAWIGNVHVYGSSRQAHSYFNLADPLLSFWFGVLTILTTRSLLVEVLEVLMEEVPRNMCYASLVDEMEEVEEVVAVEDLHVWTVGPSFVMACAEVSVDAEQIQTLNHAEKLTQHLQEHLRAQGIQHATIQLVANHGRRTNIIEEDGIPEERSSPL